MSDTVLLLSIKPRHAGAILDGTKWVETRRTLPTLGPGDLVLMYVTAPHSKIEGAFSVAQVLQAPPRQLWHQVKEYANLTYSEFIEYFKGSAIAYALVIAWAIRLDGAADLPRLRELGISPPQCYRYLRNQSWEMLVQKQDWKIFCELGTGPTYAQPD